MQIAMTGNSYATGTAPGTWPYFNDSPAGYIMLGWNGLTAGGNAARDYTGFTMTWSYSTAWNYSASSEGISVDSGYIIQTYNQFSNTFNRNIPTLPFSQGIKPATQIRRGLPFAYSSSK